jgi:hypothetical protein
MVHILVVVIAMTGPTMITGIRIAWSAPLRRVRGFCT